MFISSSVIPGRNPLRRFAVFMLFLISMTACRAPTPAEQVLLQKFVEGGDAQDVPQSVIDQLSSTADMASSEVAGRYLATARIPTVGACLYPRRGQYMGFSHFPNHRSQQQLDADVAQAYERWKSKYLIRIPPDSSVGPTLFRVSFGQAEPERTVSEGQAYGMLLAALMAGYDQEAQQIFDGLYAFAQAHPSNMDDRLMAWTVPNEGTAAAFDAEADIAYALMLADATWTGSSSINYRVEADSRLAALLERTIGPQSSLPMLGDWVDPWGEQYNQFTPRSSDLIAFYFRAFARYTDNTRWDEVADASVSLISQFQTRKPDATALLPDFIRVTQTPEYKVQAAAPGFLEGDFDGAYYYNAGRVPWRIGLDALVSGDAESVRQLSRFAEFTQAEMKEAGPLGLRGGYYLNGEMIDDYFSVFFASPLAISLMGEETAQAELNTLYDAVFEAEEDYYQDSVSLLSLIVLTGNFWDPTVEGCISRQP